MTLLTAVLLFIAAVLGSIASALCLTKKALRIVCMVLCILLAAALAVYIGLTFIFVDAAENMPHAP